MTLLPYCQRDSKGYVPYIYGLIVFKEPTRYSSHRILWKYSNNHFF